MNSALHDQNDSFVDFAQPLLFRCLVYTPQQGLCLNRRGDTSVSCECKCLVEILTPAKDPTGFTGQSLRVPSCVLPVMAVTDISGRLECSMLKPGLLLLGAEHASNISTHLGSGVAYRVIAEAPCPTFTIPKGGKARASVTIQPFSKRSVFI